MTLDDIVRKLRQAHQLGTLGNKFSHYQRPHVLIVDEVATSDLAHADAHRFFQLINRRYTRPSMIITSNERVSDWDELFGDEVQAVAILDRLRHDAEILTINGPAWRLRGHGDLLAQRSDGTAKTADRYPSATPPNAAEGLRRDGLTAASAPTDPPQAQSAA